MFGFMSTTSETNSSGLSPSLLRDPPVSGMMTPPVSKRQPGLRKTVTELYNEVSDRKRFSFTLQTAGMVTNVTSASCKIATGGSLLQME